MAPRLLAIDLDGTLLEGGGVSDHDREAIHRARRAGCEVVIATGRAWNESRVALDAVGEPGVMIAAGGALLNDSATGRTLDRCVVSAEIVQTVAHRLRDRGHVVHLLQDRSACGFDYWMVGWDRLHEATRWWFDRHDIVARWVGRFDQVDDLAHTVRVGTTADGDDLAPLADEIRSELGDRVVVQAWPAVVEAVSPKRSIHLLEAFDAVVDKWTMLSRLARDRGITPSGIVAIGDGLNDVGMIREAGIGIAMEGADARVLAVADRRTGPPGRGVGDAIHALLDEGEEPAA